MKMRNIVKMREKKRELVEIEILNPNLSAHPTRLDLRPRPKPQKD